MLKLYYSLCIFLILCFAEATKQAANAAKARDAEEKMTIDYNKLAPAISDRNPQLVQLLMLIREKSAFKNDQVIIMLACLSKVLWYNGYRGFQKK